MAKVSDYFLQCCHSELAEHKITPPSMDALREIVESDGILAEASAHYSENEGSYGLDTYERESLLDAVSWAMTEMYWPMNGDPESYTKRWFDKLTKGLEAAGWKYNFEI